MSWETVIGLETHVELSTRTKLFCGCAAVFGGEPNTRCCPVCTGMPGSLPVLNETALEYAVLAGLALNCEITRLCRFDRKNYHYPDLPKAYQISQRWLPLACGGFVELKNGRRVRIRELHMEEDAGKLIHDAEAGRSRIDYNRCGVPLIEIVTEPDFRTAEEVIDYLERLRSTLQYLGVSDCKLQEGSLRCDVNLSLRPAGKEEMGMRTELKNLGSFRAVSRAIAFESARQATLLESGGQVAPETRRWDEEQNASFVMRAKEEAGDYRYFPEPDIPPIHISDTWMKACARAIPELAREKKARYLSQYGLSEYDAETLTSQRALAAFFEETVALGAPPKEAANWMMGHVLRNLSELKTDIREIRFTPKTLVGLIEHVQSGMLNRGTAASVLDAVFETDGDVSAYIKAHGLEQISDTGAVGRAVGEVLTANPKSVADYHAGKERAFGFLMGQAMRLLGGRGDPSLVRTTLECALREK